jgi:hypothetical protein
MVWDKFSEELMNDIGANLHDSPLDQLILKGHLIIEKQIDFIIDSLTSNDFTIAKTNFSFRNKIELLKALGIAEYEEDIIEVLVKLNIVRNKIAHSLENDRRHFEDLIRLSLKQFGSDFNFKNDSFRAGYLMLLIPYLAGRLSALIDVKKPRDIDCWTRNYLDYLNQE